MTPLPRFYPVVPDAMHVAAVVDGGAKLVQLRAKSTDQAWLDAQIRSSLARCRQAGAQLVVNDHWELALALHADFVHLGQEDLDGADLAALRRHGVRYGISTHDHDELARALAARPAYVALGPIWETTLKRMRWAPQGIARISEWRRRIGDLALVAIGGITLERAAACLEAGADSVAAVNDIVNAPDVRARAQAWAAQLEPAL